MRRTIEVIPSIILIAIFIFSLYQRAIHAPWVNTFVLGLAGTAVYSVVIIFIDGLSFAFRYDRPLKLGSKIFFTYMTIMAIISITFSIYLMAHN